MEVMCRVYPNMGLCMAMVERRPNFGNVLARGALPGIKTDPVKARNFLK